MRAHVSTQPLGLRTETGGLPPGQRAAARPQHGPHAEGGTSPAARARRLPGGPPVRRPPRPHGGGLRYRGPRRPPRLPLLPPLLPLLRVSREAQREERQGGLEAGKQGEDEVLPGVCTAGVRISGGDAEGAAAAERCGLGARVGLPRRLPRVRRGRHAQQGDWRHDTPRLCGLRRHPLLEDLSWSKCRTK